MTNLNINPLTPCPCCSNLNYDQCCQPFHLKTKHAQTPEQLMRSRFCAFFLKNYAYLIETHHSDFRQGLTEDVLAQEPLPQWLSLEVSTSSFDGDKGKVTFQAWYQLDGDIDAIHESSEFIKQDGLWFYTQGEQKEAIYPKRNDKCVCRSGKKFKQCCGG